MALHSSSSGGTCRRLARVSGRWGANSLGIPRGLDLEVGNIAWSSVGLELIWAPEAKVAAESAAIVEHNNRDWAG